MVAINATAATLPSHLFAAATMSNIAITSVCHHHHVNRCHAHQQHEDNQQHHAHLQHQQHQQQQQHQ
eukprot:8684161-Lingulodinium_polyedra.AAC.1